MLQYIGSCRIRTHRNSKTHTSYLTNRPGQPMQNAMLPFRGSSLLETRYRSEKQLSSVAQPDSAARQKAAGFSTRDLSISRASSGAGSREVRRDAERLRADIRDGIFLARRRAGAARSLAASWLGWKCVVAGGSLVAAEGRRLE